MSDFETIKQQLTDVANGLRGSKGNVILSQRLYNCLNKSKVKGKQVGKAGGYEVSVSALCEAVDNGDFVLRKAK